MGVYACVCVISIYHPEDFKHLKDNILSLITVLLYVYHHVSGVE